jgi:hypothetical protein
LTLDGSCEDAVLDKTNKLIFIALGSSGIQVISYSNSSILAKVARYNATSFISNKLAKLDLKKIISCRPTLCQFFDLNSNSAI